MKIIICKRNTGMSPIHLLLVASVIAAVAGLLILVAQNTSLINERNRTICRSQLLQIEAAKLRYAIGQKLSLTNAVGEQEIFGALNLRPSCPDDGTYTIGGTVGEKPACSVEGHAIGQPKSE